MFGLVLAASLATFGRAFGQTTTNIDDPLLDLFVQKGFVTQEEAQKVKAEADSLRTNQIPTWVSPSKWKISSGIKNIELSGDVRLRYEKRMATDPNGGDVALDRLRYALRLNLRGQAFDDFYYGFRLETGSNPRSAWLTFGNNDGASGVFSKSGSSVNLGQIYLGWHPAGWLEVTLGKMPNPLYTTSMVWDPDISPEGAAEHFKYSVGQADFALNLGQFLYQDTNPTKASSGFFDPLTVNSSGLPFLFAWQGGVNFNFTTNINFKVMPALYQYVNQFGDGRSPSINSYSPDFSGTYVGQGSTVGVNGVPASYNLSDDAYGFDGFFSNETGINNLLVLEIPFELDIRLNKVDLTLFGDYAQNLQGSERATAAYNAANSTYWSDNQLPIDPISSPQTHDDKAYQFGLSIASSSSAGLVNGANPRKHAWELRTYWQHVEQYSLDPNLVDSDFFGGVENLEGIYVSFAYGFSANMIGTFRYGHASRINDQLGTGGASPDLPQMNPVNDYNLFQVDFTFRF